ncbi:hypothetical protein Afe04nite_84400 [Asanoa ferruginea]|nr:hypothetical protein Afe04nite_84400 [Asanoa ferruginea]
MVDPIFWRPAPCLGGGSPSFLWLRFGSGEGVMRWSYGLGESAFTLQRMTPSPDLTQSLAASMITVRGAQSDG